MKDLKKFEEFRLSKAAQKNIIGADGFCDCHDYASNFGNYHPGQYIYQQRLSYCNYLVSQGGCP